MIVETAAERRAPKTVERQSALTVIGGGIAGICASLAAARAGLRTTLVTDRPVVGGNASSEVRLWMLGATSHMGNNNRWAREGGIVDEILVENLYRNPEGNPLILDALLLEMLRAEKNLELLLNTAAYEIEKHADGRIASVTAFCSQNSTRYVLRSPLFCDASGDGIIGFLSGAAFRMGAESRDEFDEGMAPPESFGELLGHSLYFYSKDAGRPVRFVPPAFALPDIAVIPRYRDIRASDYGCRFWWFEWGGRLDTVHETEAIKWELWKVAYGVWNYIKNSGKFPEAENLTLEWMGSIPGKRESRRFEGDYLLTQRDVVEQREHLDAVSFGGWAIDLHPADGVYSETSPCTQWHSKGLYQIPYRCLYSRDVPNLFLAGRIISVSHVAFGSTRVMATCGNNAEAVGMAAALCHENAWLPRDLLEPCRMQELQRRLLRQGHYLPGVPAKDPGDLAQLATVSASSSFSVARFPANGKLVALDTPRAMLLPVKAGPLPAVTFTIEVESETTVEFEVRTSERTGNFTPDKLLYKGSSPLAPGKSQPVTVRPDASINCDGYLFYSLLRQPGVSVHLSDVRVTGVLSVSQSGNAAVAKSAKQEPPAGSGIESFEFWLPARRPGGHNFALTVDPPLQPFAAGNVLNGVARPTTAANAWVAALEDGSPRLTLRWTKPQQIARVELSFDTDFDHPMESVLMGHPENEIPFCLKSFLLRDENEQVLFECADNRRTRQAAFLNKPVRTAALHIDVLETRGAPAAIFEVRCYEK